MERADTSLGGVITIEPSQHGGRYVTLRIDIGTLNVFHMVAQLSQTDDGDEAIAAAAVALRAGLRAWFDRSMR